MYQQALRRFAHFDAIQLSDPASLKELILLALKEEDIESGFQEREELKEKIAEVSFYPGWLFFLISDVFLQNLYHSIQFNSGNLINESWTSIKTGEVKQDKIENL